jgi:EAL domain-containing protein (putative c-di-GMP-specific phosphodiesterase class I)
VDQNRRPTGAEALVRWRHPQRRDWCRPPTFIPLAEETGLIMPLGQWILQTACAQIKAWEGARLTDHLVLAVNISARQLGADNFVAVRDLSARAQDLRGYL